MLNEDAVSGIRSPTMQIGQISDTHGTDDDGNDSTPSTHSIKVGQTISTVVGLLSVCGSTLIILAYASTSWGLWRVKQGAGTVEKIRAIVEGYLLQLFWLSVADWFSGWAYGISRFATPTDFETVNTICVIQTVSIAYFPLVALFWTCVLALELHRFIVYPHWDLFGDFSRRRYRWYHIACWGIPAVFVLIVGFNMDAQNAGLWCWFQEPGKRLHTTFFFIYLTSIIVWVFILALYIHMGLKIRRTVKEENRKPSESVKTMLIAMCLYPLVFVIMYIFQFLNRIGVGTSGHGNFFSSTTLAYATAATAPIQGLLNALVYVSTNRKVRRLLCRRWRKEENAATRIRPLLESRRESSQQCEGPAAILYDAGNQTADSQGTPRQSVDDSEQQVLLAYENGVNYEAYDVEVVGNSINCRNSDEDIF